VSRFSAGLGVLLLTAGQVSGGTLPDFGAYRASVLRGEAGALSGRAYSERRTPAGPEVPLTDTVVRLVPYSETFLAESEEVKGHSRDSLRAYRMAALEVKRLQDAYERAVWEAGAADLVLSSVVDSAGGFAFPAVAAGSWVILGRREIPSPVKPRHTRRKADRQAFALSPEIVGYRTASFWMIPVKVAAGVPTTVELTDRNIWFSGVIEEAASRDTAR